MDGVMGCSHAFDHDGFDLAGAATPEGGGCIVFRRSEAGDALPEGRKFDHDEPMEFVRPLHDLETSTPRQNLAAELRDNGGNQIGVFFVFDRIVDLRTRNPVSGHRPLLVVMTGLVPAIHVLNDETVKTWMPGTSPGMTEARQYGSQESRHFPAARKRSNSHTARPWTPDPISRSRSQRRRQY